MHPFSLVAVRRERRPSLIQTLSRCSARQGSLKLPAAGYLSMNTAAWQPPRTAPEPVNASLKTEDKGAGCGQAAGMILEMAHSAHVPTPLRVLVSEGSSTSAREAITILGLSGHLVEVCDPSPYCLARFSRFVDKFHRCPGLRDDPAGFLSFVEDLLAPRHFDVLLPIHEQGFLFARVQERLGDRAGLALPSFVSYRAAHGKAGFSQLLDQLGLPQPVTRIVKSADELRHVARFPAIIKTSIGTASRGIWFVRNEADLEGAVQELSAQHLSANGEFADEVLMQEWVAGTTEKAQAVFCRGKLIGFHAYRQIA